MAFLILVLALPAGMAHAQGNQPASAPKAARPPETPEARINRLFSDLKSARSPQDAQRTAAIVLRTLGQDANPTAALLVSRASQALARKEPDVAQSLMDAASDLYPKETVVSYARASLLAERGDYLGSMLALEAVIRAEPRHFLAWNDLATLLQRLGQDKQALKALRQVEGLYPLFPGLAERIGRLSRDVEGVPL